VTTNAPDLEDVEEHEWSGIVLVLAMLAVCGALVLLFA